MDKRQVGSEGQSLRKHMEASFWVTAAACGQQGEQAAQPWLFEEAKGSLGFPARKKSPSSQKSSPLCPISYLSPGIEGPE